MTAAARITQADIERIAKAVKNAGWPSARLICNYANGSIEVFMSDKGSDPVPAEDENEWDRVFDDQGDHQP